MNVRRKLPGLISIPFLLIPLTFLTNLSHAIQRVTPDSISTKGPITDRIPSSLINMGDGDKSYAILVDKSKQKLYLYSYGNHGYVLSKIFNSSTGENSGDKERKGDFKTPEGVYFVTEIIEGRELPPKYGVKAFVLDYPNYLDKRRNKGGNGIWLHGTNKELMPTDTNGCIALENEDVLYLSRYIEPYSTPIIIKEKIDYLHKDSLLQENREIQDFISKWLSYWENKELDNYMASYSERFRSENMDWQSWRAKKRSLNRIYKTINITLENLRIFRQKDSVVALFLQGYHSGSFDSFGLKRLYLEKGKNGWEIIGETWSPLPPSLKKYRDRLAKNILKPKEKPLIKPTLESEEQSIRSFISKWKAYWENKELDRYMSCYSKGFNAKGRGWQSWRDYKKALNKKVRTINIKIGDIKILKQENKVIADFRQDYRSDSYDDSGIKRLYLEKKGDDWEIVGEDWKSDFDNDSTQK
ncbi:MAG: L,D-transpeptidase [Desulfobacteria bacterium]